MRAQERSTAAAILDGTGKGFMNALSYVYLGKGRGCNLYATAKGRA
jgi:hypothetical protein